MSLSPTATLVDAFPPSDSKSPFFAHRALDSTLDPSMSLSGGALDFPFLLDTATTKLAPPAPFTFPSPPPSNHSSDNGLDFDLESFAHCSPDSDLALGFASTPSSTTLISPKSFADLPSTPINTIPAFEETLSLGPAAADPQAAEALSNHHLQRYFHYKALAAQAEAAASQQEQFDAILAYTMTGDERAFIPAAQGSCPPSLAQPQPFFGQTSAAQAFGLNYNVAAQQQQATAAAMHAQAQAHMQAHDVAMARAQQQRSLTMNYYLPSQRNILETLPQAQPMWNRHSIASSVSSTSYPSTPVNSQPLLPVMSKTEVSATATTAPITNNKQQAYPPSEGENELEEEDQLNDDNDSSLTSSAPIANAHGGGRGYIPGQTPDDPKKKHKCTICGRGFARAFNLKVCYIDLKPFRVLR